MKKNILLSLFAASCIFTGANAQIIGPSNPPCSTPVTYMTTTNAFTYHWDFSNTGFFTVLPSPPPSTVTNLIPPGSLSVPAMGCFVQDVPGSGGAYHYFVTEYNTGNLWRFDFTSFPSTYTATNLGNFGLLTGNTEAIDLVQQGGHWYGLMVNYTQLVELDFGTLTNPTPTVNVVPLPSLLWPHQLTIKYYDDGIAGDPLWHAFVANRNGSLLRLDFGTTISSLMTTPTPTPIPNVGSVANPCNFTLYQDPASSNWFALVTSLINATVSRYDFGPNLMNASPSGTLLTAPAGLLDLPRGINIFSDCQGNLVAYEFNETGNVNSINFGGSIKNTPTYSLWATTGIGTTGCSATCAANGMFTFILPDFGNGGIYYYAPAFYSFPPVSFADYFTLSQNMTFPGSGPYDLSLIYDMGRPSGPSVAPCKVVKPECNVPCYDPKQTAMNVTQSTVDPCTFTACVSVSTANTITGYTWDVEPGSTIFTNASSLPNDCFTFSIAPGAVYTVTVTAHIVDANLNCCEAVLSQRLQCGDNTANPADRQMPDASGVSNVNKAAGDIQIFPNPTTNEVTISAPNVGISSIQVFDVKGQKLKDYSYDASKETNISLDKLPVGTYIFRVNNLISKIVTKTE